MRPTLESARDQDIPGQSNPHGMFTCQVSGKGRAKAPKAEPKAKPKAKPKAEPKAKAAAKRLQPEDMESDGPLAKAPCKRQAVYVLIDGWKMQRSAGDCPAHPPFPFQEAGKARSPAHRRVHRVDPRGSMTSRVFYSTRSS